MRTSRLQWTRPYYGVQHLGTLGDRYWVTVCDYGSFADLTTWTKGQGFVDTPTEHCANAAEARQRGERWLQDRNAL